MLSRFAKSKKTHAIAEKSQRNLLEWLSPAAHEVKQKQRDVFARRVGSTGSWLLDTQEFKGWTEDPSPPILWCPGDRKWRSHMV